MSEKGGFNTFAQGDIRAAAGRARYRAGRVSLDRVSLWTRWTSREDFRGLRLSDRAAARPGTPGSREIYDRADARVPVEVDRRRNSATATRLVETDL